MGQNFKWHQWIETLESRRMSSVTAAMLAGPLTVGSTWKYDNGSSVVIQTPDKFDTVDVVTMASVSEGIADSTTTDFETLNPHRGLIDYETDYYESLTFPFGDSDRFTPEKVLFPTVLTAGKKYVDRYHSEFVTEAGEAGSTGAGSIETDQVTLVSDTPQSVAVPAGTFSAFEVVEESQGETVTQWIAPGVGLVQETDSDGSDAPTTRQLTNYSISGSPTSAQLAGRIVGAKVPDSIVAGTVIRSWIAVSLFNVGAAAEAGPVTLQVFAVPSSTLTTTLVGSITTRQLTISIGQTIPTRIPIRWNTTGLYDAYSLSLVVTDAAGNAITTNPLTGSASDIAVAPASIAINPSISSATKQGVVVTVSNGGNVPAEERGQLQLLGSDSSTEPTSPSGAAVLIEVPATFNLKPGQSRKVVIHLSRSQVATINSYAWLIASIVSADAGPIDYTKLPLS